MWRTKVSKDRVNCIAAFLTEGHTYREAAEEFGHDRRTISRWVRCIEDDEIQQKALSGEEAAKRLRYVRPYRTYASYMAQVHTETETMERFQIDEGELEKALQILAKYPEYERLVMMAHAGARCAARKRR